MQMPPRNVYIEPGTISETFFICTIRSSHLGERFAPSSRLGMMCNCNVIAAREMST